MRTDPHGRIFQRITEAFPLIEPAQQWSDARNPYALQFQRHTGARRFIRSRAVQDHFPVDRKLVFPLYYFLGSNTNSAWNRPPVTL
jgi:hypothetical protein